MRPEGWHVPGSGTGVKTRWRVKALSEGTPIWLRSHKRMGTEVKRARNPKGGHANMAAFSQREGDERRNREKLKGRARQYGCVLPREGEEGKDRKRPEGAAVGREHGLSKEDWLMRGQSGDGGGGQSSDFEVEQDPYPMYRRRQKL